MGSKFGKSTDEPAGMASTCGVNASIFCDMMASGREAGTVGEGRPIGSSQPTTPENFLWLRTSGSRDLTSSTVPCTGPATAGRSQQRLKHIRKCQVIVVVQ